MVENNLTEAAEQGYFDNTSRRLIDTYTEALWSAANSHGRSSAIREEAEGLAVAVRTGELIKLFFEGNGTSRDQRSELLKKVFEGKVDELLSNFVQVLNNHDRLYLFGDILVAYQKFDDAKQGRVDVDVTSAYSLSPAQLANIEGVIRNRLGKVPRFHQKLDATLLGGMVVRVGDMVWDQSSKSKLNRLTQLLEEKGTHEIQAGRDRFRTPE